jgi:hypothetical protein
MTGRRVANPPQDAILPQSGKPQTHSHRPGRLRAGRGRPIDNRPQDAILSSWPCGPPKVMKTSPGHTSPDHILMQRPAARSREVGARFSTVPHIRKAGGKLTRAMRENRETPWNHRRRLARPKISLGFTCRTNRFRLVLYKNNIGVSAQGNGVAKAGDFGMGGIFAPRFIPERHSSGPRVAEFTMSHLTFLGMSVYIV